MVVGTVVWHEHTLDSVVLYRRWGRARRSRITRAGFKPPYAAGVKSPGAERLRRRQEYLSGRKQGDECKRTAEEVSKHVLLASEPGIPRFPGIRLEGPVYWPGGVRYKGGVNLVQASVWNVRTCLIYLKKCLIKRLTMIE